MNRFLIPLLAALALPTAVNAETWILMHSKGGYSNYIDASSVVKNGFWRYANLKYTSTAGGGHVSGIKVNCKEDFYIYSNATRTLDEPSTLTFTRKSKDNWVTTIMEVEEDVGERYNKLAEGIYQFLCKEWE